MSSGSGMIGPVGPGPLGQAMKPQCSLALAESGTMDVIAKTKRAFKKVSFLCLIAPTTLEVIVHNAYGLKIRVNDRWANKTHPALF